MGAGVNITITTNDNSTRKFYVCLDGKDISDDVIAVGFVANVGTLDPPTVVLTLVPEQVQISDDMRVLLERMEL